MKSLVILGSTGSIGTQTVEVAEHLELKINAISGYANDSLLEEQARRFNVETVWISERKYSSLKTRLADTSSKVVTGEEELERIASETPCDVLVNSLVGISGLKPTLAALDGKKRVALANKETLVAAGKIVMAAARREGVKILPVDSEHCAIAQCLTAGRHEEVSRLIITASGGPFFGRTRDELRDITPSMALSHPTWNMGAKITVDSATMMNKGFEVIEACRLFDIPPERIDTIVHRESVIHSMVEYNDRSVIAQMAVPDMRMCVRYALFYPERVECSAQRLDLASIGKLTFYKPDFENFPLLGAAYDALRRGGVIPCVLNAANEEAVSLFLAGKIRFTDIFSSVCEVTSAFKNIDSPDLDDIYSADGEARRAVDGYFGI